jgi:hypothetical protein
MAKRVKPRLTTSAGEIGQLQYNEKAYAQRNVKVGGVYTIIGAANTAKRVGMFAALRVVNPDSSAHYIAIGASTLTAPTGIANGHFIPAGGELYISTGDQGDYVRTDSAAVGVYKLEDSIVITDRPNDQPQV